MEWPLHRPWGNTAMTSESFFATAVAGLIGLFFGFGLGAQRIRAVFGLIVANIVGAATAT